jgi:hypothetical protein
MPPAKVRALALALLGAASPALFGQSFPPPVASYQISCRLDTEKKTVEGTELLTWKNTTSLPASTLRFHLYLNAFRNTLSTFWKESGGESRDGKLPASWASIEVLRMTAADGADLLLSLKYVSPDDGNTQDRTVAEVLLPKSVLPGETISVAIDFLSRLPRVSVRTGYEDDFFFVAQWFPKIGVLEEKGWNCHQYHATSEYFADFGSYDVSIDVPSRFKGKVGATGRLVEERETSSGRILYRFQQDGVHDFAWTADPGYLVLEDVFREPGVGDAKLLLLLQPEHAAQAGRHFRAAKAALSGYGRILGPYPYPTLTIVDPPWGAHGAGGMEYPTLITAGTSWSAPAKVLRPEGVTVHETGHQFFYGLIASNEFEEAWLDEGFNSYHEDKAGQIALGPQGWGRRYFGPLRSGRGSRAPVPVIAPDVWLKRGEAELAALRKSGAIDIMARRGWDYRSPESYVINSYGKPALSLQTLEALVGDETMTQIMRTYARRYRFAHPTSEDFIAVVNEVTHQDYRWFFDQTWFSAELCDYAVTVKNERVRPAAGYVDGRDGRPLLTPPAREDGEKDAGTFDSEVVVQRLGGVRLPVELRVEFADGREVRESWDGQYRWTRYRYHGAKVRAAEIDPDGKIALDVDPGNNAWADNEPVARRAASKWAMRWMFWLQNLLELHTLLG